MLSAAYRIGLALALAAVAGAAGADASRVPKPVVTIEKPGKCVDDPQVMRREHMNMLRHDRDRTVHGGVRKVKASLKECIDCHASSRNGSAIGTRENFCQSCHDYVAVKLDCFECHTAKPAPKLAAAPVSEEVKQ